jgi:hypothetical protein
LDGSPLNNLQDDEENAGNKTPVKGLGLGVGDLSLDKEEEQKIIDKQVTNSDNGNADNMCRICFSDDSDKENPLISPCKCSGSMQYVHLNCLR